MKFARLVFLVAGVYGLVALLPMYFMEEEAASGNTLPRLEFYYGFIGVAVAWQLAFLVMSRAPARYRLLMIPAIVEKASFAIPVAVLYVQQRVSTFMFGAGMVDAFLGALFVLAYLRTTKRRRCEAHVPHGRCAER